MSISSSAYDEKLSYAFKLFPYETPNRAQNRIMQQIIALDDHEQIFLESPTGSGKSIASLTSLLARIQTDEKIIVFTRTVSQMEPILREWGRIYKFDDVIADKAPLILPMLGKSRLCKQLPILRKNMIKLEVAAQSVHVLCKSLPCMLHPSVDTEGMYAVKSGKYRLKKINMKISGAAKNRSPPIDDIVNNLLMEPYCGYYGLRSMTKFATIIVATYPYLKGPLFSILLKSLDVPIDKVHILIDEAHNLVQSSETVLHKSQIVKTKAIFGPFPILNKFLSVMRFNRQISPNQIATEDEYNEISEMISNCDPEMRKRLGINLGMVTDPSVVAVAQFLRARHSGKIYTSSDKLKIIQPTPIDFLKPLKEAKTVIFQSGTFTPIDVYKKLYGFHEAKSMIIEPMRDDQRFISFLTWKGMTSKFNRRGPVQFGNMATSVLLLTRISPRHVLVVCPSYDFLEEFLPYLQEHNDDNAYYQYQVEYEQEDLDVQKLANKVAYSTRNIILLGVAGGKISEGVEFVKNGHSMVSTIIFAGLPYRPITRENVFIRNIIAAIAANSEVAKQLEQQIPIVRLVRQAFGRSIRSDQDRGALIILDFRAEDLLKRELGLLHYKQIRNLITDLHQFFKGYDRLENIK